MSRIRKQPRRSTKKISHPIIRNIFAEDQSYQNVLPRQIIIKLSRTQELSIKNLQEFIPEPMYNQLNDNLSQMRQALSHQRSKISSIPLELDFQRLQPINHHEQLREQTKKTANSINQYQQQMMMLNSDDENIFFQFDQMQERRRLNNEHHQDYLEIEEKNHIGGLMSNQQLDILSLIN